MDPRLAPLGDFSCPTSFNEISWTKLLVDVLFAAQYDNAEERDRQYGTYDSNH
jgi:hypothetical protein